MGWGTNTEEGIICVAGDLIRMKETGVRGGLLNRGGH